MCLADQGCNVPSSSRTCLEADISSTVLYMLNLSRPPATKRRSFRGHEEEELKANFMSCFIRAHLTSHFGGESPQHLVAEGSWLLSLYRPCGSRGSCISTTLEAIIESSFLGGLPCVMLVAGSWRDAGLCPLHRCRV